jgi:predicted ATPase
MKIAFIGSHGVGKTTLCYELAAALKKRDHALELVMEVARRCPLPINRDTTVAAQTWILHQQVCREIEAEAAGGLVICDRAVIDNYAYLVHAAGRQAAREPFLREWLGTYGLLVKVPVVAPPAFDGTRDTSVGFQKAIDGIIDDLLGAFATPCLALAPQERPAWNEAVLSALAEAG